MARVFGDIPGVAVGATFANRKALAQSGLHRPLVAGISAEARKERTPSSSLGATRTTVTTVKP